MPPNKNGVYKLIACKHHNAPQCTKTHHAATKTTALHHKNHRTASQKPPRCTTKRTTTVNPTAGSIYEAVSGGAEYEITASNGTTTQACKFEIPHTNCIQRVTSSQTCATWSLPQDGDWAGRNIAIPNF